MTMALRWFAAAWLVTMCVPARALAQDPDTPPPGTAVFGPVRITPSLMLKDMGIDNNVFNESVDPKSDFTFTLTPRADIVFRARRLKLGYTSVVDYVYFKTYDDEGGVNSSGSARMDLDLGRLRPYAMIRGVRTKARLNAEVDARAHHRDSTYGAGLALLIASRTRLVTNASRTQVAFDEGEAFRGVNLGAAFDGQRDTVDGGIGIELTPLTSLTILVTRETQRFDLSPDRDADSWRVAPTLTFSNDGPLTGNATIGYRHFHTRSAATPDYSGLTSALNVGATFYGRHQLLAVANRDVQYSYDESTDYYVGTTLGLTWTSPLVGRIDARATTTRSVMDYRTVAAAAGRDTQLVYGAGIGYRVTPHARVGVNAEWTRRESDRTDLRGFRNHRLFAGLTWGMQL
jgi:hypothetical protein